MNRHKVILTLAGFVLAAGMAVTVQAGPAPDACPGSHQLVSVKDAEFFDTAKRVDLSGNHNKLVCEKKGGGPQDYVDDAD